MFKQTEMAECEKNLAFIREHKVVTICRKVYGDDLLRLTEALCAGGVKLMEVTFDQGDPQCLERTAEAIRMIRERFEGGVLPGAGTVLSPNQVKIAKQAGAAYIISPNTNLSVIGETLKAGLVSIPGAMTPSEIMTAHDAGAHLVKLFPAGSLGMKYIQDILAPINHVGLVATGGVTEENWPDYLKLGFAGAGVSSRLCDKKRIAEGDFAEITKRADAFRRITAEYRI